MIRIGVIGYGYWGPNLVRNFAETPEAQVTWVADRDRKRLAGVQARYPAVRVTQDAAELMGATDVDAVVVATPVSTHFDLALAALKAGKHVLVEKPLTQNAEQAMKLIEEADRRSRVLMVDHTFVYTGAVRKIREMIDTRELGEIQGYDSVRINLGLFQRDVNVLWDLAVHDLSIMDYLLPFRPCAVSATGINHVPGGPENTAYLTLFFDTSCIGHVHVSWLSPVKIRHTLVGGSRKMVVYDDLEPSEKVKVYDRGITVTPDARNLYDMLIGYRMGDMLAPRVEPAEALKVEAGHFVECVTAGKQPLTDGSAGLRVIRLLEAATASMKARGQMVELRGGL